MKMNFHHWFMRRFDENRSDADFVSSGKYPIHSLAGSAEVNATLPAVSGIILIVLSVFLTLLGGLIPSRKAAKSDPVAALRSE